MNKVAMYKEEIFKTANEKRMSPAEQVVDNQKKTYAKRFKTAKSDISNKDIKKIQQNDQKQSLQRTGGIYGLAGGGAVATGAMKSGNVDGIKRMGHITDASRVDSIKKHGLKGTKLDDDVLTTRVLNEKIKNGTINAKDVKGKVYLANNLETELSIRGGKMQNGFTEKQKKVKVHMPLEEVKKRSTSNPELLGAKNGDEFVRKFRETNVFVPYNDAQLKKVYKNLSKGTTVIDGDVASKYIKGSKDYQRNTLKNVAKHIKNNPKAFAKGVGQLGAGGALMGASAVALSKGLKKKSLDDIRKNK